MIKASSKETGEEVAIKMVKKEDLDEEDLKNIHTEVMVSANVSICIQLDSEHDWKFFIFREFLLTGK